MEYKLFILVLIVLFIINIFLTIKLYKKFKKLKNNYTEQLNENQFLIREINRNKYQNDLLKNLPKNTTQKVLIGDYNKESIKNTISIIKKFNLDFDIVTSSDDIIDKIKHNDKYDIIITNNIYKHGCDGPTLLRKLKEINGFNTPVIINTVSYGNKDYFINICGFDGYIEKPIDEKSIEPILQKFLK